MDEWIELHVIRDLSKHSSYKLLVREKDIISVYIDGVDTKVAARVALKNGKKETYLTCYNSYEYLKEKLTRVKQDD